MVANFFFVVNIFKLWWKPFRGANPIRHGALLAKILAPVDESPALKPRPRVEINHSRNTTSTRHMFQTFVPLLKTIPRPHGFKFQNSSPRNDQD